MPAATSPPAARTEKEEQLWIALKRHIMRERQRKKEEQEAEVEEERLRKEREAREKQDEMTLGETRDQIQIFGTKLEDLKNEKKQLFLKLKKVLNEDDNRKRQLHKEANEMFAMHALQQQVPQPQLFLPPRNPHPQQQQLIQKTSGGPMGNSNSQIKRSRSPSPPQGYYKTGNSQQYPQPPKHEDGRRGGEPNRAVLWNKPTQYTNAPGTLFYPNAPSNPPDSRSHPPILFSAYGNLNMRPNYLVEMPPQSAVPQNQPPPQMTNKMDKSHQQGNVYHINLDPPNQQQSHQVIGPPPTHKSIQQNPITLEKIQDPRNSGYHIEIKHDDRKDVRSSQPNQQHLPEGLVYTNPIRHIPLIGGVMSMPQNQPNKPTGNITQNYQNRPQNQQPPQQQQPGPIHFPRHRY